LLKAVIVTLVFTPIPLIAILYSAITYFSFLPISYLFLIISSNSSLLKQILKFLIYICMFNSIGVILDGAIGIDNLPFIPKGISSALSAINTVDVTGETRGSFFLGSATSIFPLLSIGTLCSLVLTKLDKSFKSSVIALLSLFFTWLAFFFSFSRGPLLFGSLFTAFAFLSLINSNRKINSATKVLTLMFMAFFILILAVSDIQELFLDQLSPFQRQRFETILSAEDRGNEARLNHWSEAISLFGNPEAWTGYGLASSNIRMGELYQYDIKTHYESSFFLTFSEAGFAGIIARFAPAFYICKFAFGTFRMKTIFMTYTLLFTGNLLISPLINEYSVQLAYFLVLGICISVQNLPNSSK
jgi:hypothetical protein